MQKEFIDRCAAAAKLPEGGVKPAVLRDMWQFLSKDAGAVETGDQAALDECVMNFFMKLDDSDLLFEVRSNNGRPADKN